MRRPDGAAPARRSLMAARGGAVRAPADPVVLVRGDDPVLRDEAARAAVTTALAGEDASFAVDEFSGEDFELAVAVDAASTPPMFSRRRVVVVRDVGRFSADEVEPLLDYLAGPSPTTVIVLVAGGGQIPKKLVDAVKRTGKVVDSGAATPKARQQWLADRLRRSPVRLDGRAANRLGEHLGEDVSRLGGIVSVLAAVYGDGARIGVDELEPFLGAAGAGAPWDLTDAIDRGDTPAALAHLARQLEAGDRHPLQVMASLHAHFARLLRLEGAGARVEAEAAQVLGMTGSTFPAKKALTQARKLGAGSIGRAIELLAEADLDLRGVRDLPGPLVMDILVARLSRLAAPAARR